MCCRLNHNGPLSSDVNGCISHDSQTLSWEDHSRNGLCVEQCPLLSQASRLTSKSPKLCGFLHISSLFGNSSYLRKGKTCPLTMFLPDRARGSRYLQRLSHKRHCKAAKLTRASSKCKNAPFKFFLV